MPFNERYDSANCASNEELVDGQVVLHKKDHDPIT